MSDDDAETPRSGKKWLGLGEPEGIFGKLGQSGGRWQDVAKENFAEVKRGAQFWNGEVSKGYRGLAFGRIAGVGAGTAIAAHAVLSGKKENGEDRNGLVRVGEFVLGGGMIGAGVLAGKAR